MPKTTQPKALDQEQYLRSLLNIYHTANMADSEQAQDWQQTDHAAEHCNAISGIMNNLAPHRWARYLKTGEWQEQVYGPIFTTTTTPTTTNTKDKTMSTSNNTETATYHIDTDMLGSDWRGTDVDLQALSSLLQDKLRVAGIDVSVVASDMADNGDSDLVPESIWLEAVCEYVDSDYYMARAYIRESVDWEDTNDHKTADLADEFANTTDAEIDEEGDIYAGGRWFTIAKLAEFVAWHKAQQ